MAKIQIETLSDAHVGTGRTLLQNIDYVKLDGNTIRIVDVSKLWTSIKGNNNDKIYFKQQANKKEENRLVDDNVLEIYKELISESNAYKDISCSDKPTNTIKVCIRNGMGMPYIPGSSIKGAIRSAVVASLARGIAPEELREKAQKNRRYDDGGILERGFFGKNINEDVFRFLHVGDAYFDKGETKFANMGFINELETEMKWEERKMQTVELLKEGQKASFTMCLKPTDSINCENWNDCEESKSFLESTRDRLQGIKCLKDIKSLFKQINIHTSKLLSEEISFWEERLNKTCDGHLQNYINKCEYFKQEADDCSSRGSDSCVLRLGHGIGWRFVTGAWTERLPGWDFKEHIVPNARRDNKNKYSRYDFPKTRRMTNNDEALLVGFVKLTIIENDKQ